MRRLPSLAPYLQRFGEDVPRVNRIRADARWNSQFMPTIEKSIDVERPLRSVYRQWSRFEDYPSFMSEIVNVRKLAAGYLQWRVEFDGEERDIEIEITEQIPDRRISWQGRGHDGCSGKVDLYATPGGGTHVMLQLAYPREQLPRDADAVETVRSLVQGDLEQFKQVMEKPLNSHF